MLSCRRLLAGLLNQMESSAAFPVGGLPPGASFGDSLGSEPFVPESVFLLQPDGTADPFYQIGLIRLPALGGAEVPSPVPVILITRVQGKILAAIPFSFWHRSVARRKLPSQSCSKPASVSVGAVLDVDRENPLDGTFIKIWIGLLGEDLLQCLDFLQVQPFELENAFPTELDLPDHVPLAEALQSVADEKFSFMTAESGDLSAGSESAHCPSGGSIDRSQIDLAASSPGTSRLFVSWGGSKSTAESEVCGLDSNSFRKSHCGARPSCCPVRTSGGSFSRAARRAWQDVGGKKARFGRCGSSFSFAQNSKAGCLGRER